MCTEISVLQIKRKLPKVNRLLAARILENEEAEDEMKDVDDPHTKKKSSKKKKALSSDILKDERFKALFENKVQIIDFLPSLLLSILIFLNGVIFCSLYRTFTS